MGGGGSAVESLDGNRKVASSNPGSPRVGVEVSLGKTLNPQIAPDVQVGALHGFPWHRCVNVCMNVVNVMHNLCEAPWIKALYKCTIYHLQKTNIPH